MLSKARKKSPDISWRQGDAKKLPAENNSFDGAICTLATHHIKNIKQAYLEAFRVIKEGKFVIFTSTPEQMKQYWLWEYFPKMMENGSAVIPTITINYAFKQNIFGLKLKRKTACIRIYKRFFFSILDQKYFA